MNHNIYSEIFNEAKPFATDAKIIDVAIGSKVMAVQTHAGIGVAYNTGKFFDDSTEEEIRDFESKICRMTEKDLVDWYIEDEPLMASLALAAMNSFLLYKGKPDILEWTEKFKGKKKLAMVGNFHPIVKSLQDAGMEVIIFELDGTPGTHKPDEASKLMPSCDAVLITGSTLANKTLHTYLPYISPDADAYISGPSTPIADVLLKRFSLAPSRSINDAGVKEVARANKCINCMSKHLEKLVCSGAVHA